MVTSGCEATPASSTAVNVWATLGTGCHLLPSEYSTLSTSIFPIVSSLENPERSAAFRFHTVTSPLTFTPKREKWWPLELGRR